MVAILESNLTGPINVGSGEAHEVRAIVRLLADKLDSSDRIELGAIEAAAEPPLVVADVRRLRDELGFGPAHDLSSGLDATIRWLDRQRDGHEP